MQQRTATTLNELERAEWFSRVGIKDTAMAVVLPTWEDAIKHIGSVEWQNLCGEASNQYRERLVERSRDRFLRWNDIAIELKKTTVPFVNRKIEAVVLQHKLPKAFENMVRWDILGVCMEAEYADVYPPGFYASHAYWYVHGHFPCGWEGHFPTGRLIVY